MRRRNFDGPGFLAILLRQGPHDFILAAVAHAVNAASGNGRRAIAPTKAFDLPRERRAVCWPFLKQAGFFRLGCPVRPLPLRPVELPAYSDMRERPDSERESDGSIHRDKQ